MTIENTPDGADLTAFEQVAFEALDMIFDVEPTADPGTVTVFAPGNGTGALYIGGSLVATGDTESIFMDALLALGAHIVSSEEHLLGRPDGPAAPTLASVWDFSTKVDQIEALRERAEALRAQADALESGTVDPEG